jgi:hypothetical protein
MDFDSAPFPRVVRSLVEAHVALDGQLERRLTWKSDENRYWLILHGLLLSSHQSFLGLCLLVSDVATWRGDSSPAIAAAHTVSRTLFEALGTVLALAENRAYRARLYELADYRDRYRHLQKVRARLVGPEWTDWCARQDQFLRGFADFLDLSASERADPENELRPWPGAVSLLTKRDAAGQPWLSGTAHGAFGLLEALWYQELSRIAHQHGSALATAFLVDRMTPAVRRDAIRNVFLPGAFFHLCLLTEAERSGRWPRGPLKELRRGWGLLGSALVPAVELFALRYQDTLSFWIDPPDLDDNWEGRFG